MKASLLLEDAYSGSEIVVSRQHLVPDVERLRFMVVRRHSTYEERQDDYRTVYFSINRADVPHLMDFLQAYMDDNPLENAAD